MPLIESSDYRAPFGMRGKHSATILPSLFRRVPVPHYRRERLELSDGDFLDLDWASARIPGLTSAQATAPLEPQSLESDRLVILSHGLEGDSQGRYIRGMVRAFTGRGYDALAWNFRGCSGEDNRLLRTYHGGASDDLQAVVNHVLKTRPQYRHIALIGFSMGGNITLKYLGERGSKIDPRIRAAAAFSVPCHFADCSQVLAQKSNRIYMHKFLRTLREKVRAKKSRFPDEVDDSGLKQMRTFLEFDERFTAPTNGFRDAMDYWTSVSSLQFLPAIRVPALLVNAKNDPFLAPSCFPEAEARASDCFYFEAPEHGGHVGFAQLQDDGWFWSERRAFAFIARAVAAELDRSGPTRSETNPSRNAGKKAVRKTTEQASKKKRKSAR